jgi:sn-glycerol 3-phosphate transport system ATP-binding protein
MSTLEFHNIRKVYAGGVEAIKGVSFEIKDGEFIVIVGPSGCGKSTLLRMVAGLETISSGEIKIDGQIVNHLEPAKRDIAMVFQNYALYPHMTVFNNMAYGLRNQGVPKKEIQQRVHQTAKSLEIEDFLMRKPRELSGGQRQRVAMGRAIVREPRVFLFDEPLSNLDAKLRVQMRLEIKRLQRQLGTTSIYVTHDQVEAMTLADRLIIMNEGVAEQIGTPEELYENPATQFVATFIGSPSMNMLPVQIRADRQTAVLGGVTILPLPEQNLNVGENVTLGIRPEHLSSCTEKNKPEFQIEMVESLGAETIAYGKIIGSTEIMTLKLHGKVKLKIGQTLYLNFDQESIHLFDRKTGIRKTP